MDWIDTDGLIKMMTRFPDTEITARWCNDDRRPSHRLTFLKESGRILHIRDGHRERVTPTTFARRHHNELWRTEPFFHLQDSVQQSLAVRLVEHLIEAGELECLLEELDVPFVRICHLCHRLMTEGWVVEQYGCYCSTACLEAECPDLNPEDPPEETEVWWE